MGYEGIAKISNGTILNIINEVDSSPDLSRLAKILIDIYGESHLLLSVNVRRIVFEYLNEDEATYLNLALFGSDHIDNVWVSLQTMTLTKSRRSVLLGCFGVVESESFLSEEKVRKKADVLTLKPKYGLFKHQEYAAQKVKESLVKPRSRVLLHMPTGSGKTRTAMSISCDLIRNYSIRREDKIVVWFADTEELCDQAASEFEKAWNCLGVGETRLFCLYGDSQLKLNEINSGFVVAGLQKLSSIVKKDQSEFYDMGKRSSLLIFDEAHKVIAESYRHLIDVFQTTGKATLLGLSATPGRSTFDDDENKRFAEFFNYQKVVLEIEGYPNPVEYLQQEGYLAKTKYHPLPYKSKEILLTENDLKIIATSEDIPKSILEQLGIDSKRNILILTKALELANDCRKTIIFACSKVNAESLYALLRYKGVRVGLITSDTDSDVRRRDIDKYKNGDLLILVNFGVLTTGFDAPKTNAAIIARPTKSLTLFSQMVGRATRGVEAGGNSECDIYVINDALPGFRDMATAFSHWDEAWDNEE